LLSESTDEALFEIDDDMVPHVKTVLGRLLATSPVGKNYFQQRVVWDLQFGTKGRDEDFRHIQNNDSAVAPTLRVAL
jgi:hypothetical protein